MERVWSEKFAVAYICQEQCSLANNRAKNVKYNLSSARTMFQKVSNGLPQSQVDTYHISFKYLHKVSNLGELGMLITFIVNA